MEDKANFTMRSIKEERFEHSQAPDMETRLREAMTPLVERILKGYREKGPRDHTMSAFVDDEFEGEETIVLVGMLLPRGRELQHIESIPIALREIFRMAGRG